MKKSLLLSIFLAIITPFGKQALAENAGLLATATTKTITNSEAGLIALSTLAPSMCTSPAIAVAGFEDPDNNMSPQNAIGNQDENYASIGFSEYIKLDLTGRPLPYGSSVTIRWRRDPGDEYETPKANLWESTEYSSPDGIEYNIEVSNTAFSGYTVAVSEGTRYLTIENISYYWLRVESVTTIYPCECNDGTITLTSVPGSDNQTVCAGTAITPIVYTIGGGATGTVVSPSLPAGLTEVYDSDAKTLTISGTPIVYGTLIFNVETTGSSPCSEATATVTINVFGYSGGDGSEENPFQITTLADLKFLSENDCHWDKHFIQTTDIDATASSGWNGGTGFSPIGYYKDVTFDKYFTGSYDGQGHTIIGLTIMRTSAPIGHGQGMFGNTVDATIMGIGLLNVNIYKGDGGMSVGGLVADAISTTISRSYVTGDVKGAGTVGGLVGSLMDNSSIIESFATCEVTGTDEYIGGLVGISYYTSSIWDSYSTGKVTGLDKVGGLVGQNGYYGGSSINNSYAVGLVVGNNNTGGLVGYNDGGLVTNSFWDIQTSGQVNSSGGGTGKTTQEMKTQSTFTSAGWSFNPKWAMAECPDWSYPYLVNNRQVPEPGLEEQQNPTSGGTITANQTSVCTGNVYIEFSSSEPASGHIGILQYQWQMSTDNANFDDIAGAVNDTYTFVGTLSQNTWFRRKAKVSCKTERVASNHVAITVNSIPAAPTGSGNQSFSAGDNPTIADLVASGTNINWYDASTDGNLLSSSDPLTDKTLYYASQTVEGCESTDRLAVMVSLTSPNEAVFNSSGTFTVPENVHWIEVQVWGGGGKGADHSYDCGGGGGGGAFSSSILSVTPGDSYALNVGQGSTDWWVNGGDSWFGSATTVMAKGGLTAVMNSTSGALGGSSSAGYGEIKLDGGNGAAGNFNSGTAIYSGGGGSSAGISTKGTHATDYLGAIAPEGGGNGGDGYITSSPINIEVHSGYPGCEPGGGGGGAIGWYTGNYSGGNGANGKVIISWEAGCSTPPPTAEAQSFCNGDNPPTVSDLVVTALEGASINWYNVASGGSPLAGSTILATGLYYVSQTLNDCESARREVNVTVNETPSAPSAGSNSPVCEGTVLSLSATHIAGATYSWTGPNGFASSEQNPSINNAVIVNGGTYSVTATVNGCTSTAGDVEVTVNAIPPAPDAGSNSPVCEGSVLNLTATTIENASYLWIGPDDFTSSVQNPSIVTVTDAAVGAYSVTATVNGCTSAVGSTVVAVNKLPEAATTPTPNNGDENICYEGDEAITSITWAEREDATSWDVYFGEESLPAEVTENVTTNSYNTGTLSASTTYYWKVVPKNDCGSAESATEWTFKTKDTPCCTLPTLGGASLAAANVCHDSGAQINLTGLLPSKTFTLEYSINGAVQTPVTGITSDASGNASFTTRNLTSDDHQKTLLITGLTDTETGCSKTFSTSLTLNVVPLPVATLDDLTTTICHGETVTLTGSVTATGDWILSITGAVSGGVTVNGTGNSTFEKTVTPPVLTTTYSIMSILYNISNNNGCTSYTGFTGQAVVTADQKPILVVHNPEPVVAPNTVDLTAPAVTSGSSLPAGTTLTYWKENVQLTTEQAKAISESGTYTIRAVRGACDVPADVEVTVNSIAENTPPVLAAIGAKSVNEQAELTFTASATDQDIPAQTLSYSIDAAAIALGMSIDASTGVFSWTPTESQGGASYNVTVTVTDDGTNPADLTDFETVSITVNEVNVAPVLAAIGAKSVNEQAELTFTASATDQDIPAQTLSYSIDAAAIALGMSIDASTGVFSWTPTESQGGASYNVTVTVTDDGTNPADLTDFETVSITVNEVNVAPVLAAIGAKSVNEQAELTFTASATDQDIPAQTLSYSIDAAAIALGMSIDASTGVFSWTPTESQGGASYNVTVTVTDDGTNPADLTDFETVSITVNEVNVAPVLAAIGAKSVNEQAELTFTASATDQDIPAQTLSYSIDAAAIALGMSIDASTGVFSWTPTESQGGASYNVTVTVTDDGTNPADLTDFETVSITVNEVNVAPVLAAIGAKSVNEQAELTFTASATDQDIPAQTLSYSIDAAAIALGMSIDASTGVFSWTPTESQGGASYNVTVTVTDDGTNPADLTDFETVSITVNEVNVAPVLAAIGAKSVNEQAELTFTASATDQDIPAQTLSYSIDAAAIALGMSIDASTGVFSWTPTESQGGASYNVTVTVTDDGTNPADLTDFETVSITVNEVNVAPVLAAIGKSVKTGITFIRDQCSILQH
jgi:hypothetical protein